MLHPAAYRFTACASAEYRAFEFEEVARSCRKQGCLGDLLEAAAVQQFDEHIGGLTASASIARQAHVFDALAKVANEDAGFRSQMIDSLAPSVLALVRDDSLLPRSSRRVRSSASSAGRQVSRSEVCARHREARVDSRYRSKWSRLLRSWSRLLDAKFAALSNGALLRSSSSSSCAILRILLSRSIGARPLLAAMLPWETRNYTERVVPSEKIVEIVVAFVTLSYFSVREIYQMLFTRAIELESQEHLVDEEGSRTWRRDRRPARSSPARALRWETRRI